jgi:hypothetical protein
MMNEKVKKLAEQAGVDSSQTIANVICGDAEFFALGDEWNKLCEETRNGIIQVLERSQEKFAELIIKECVEKITTYDLVPGHSAKWEDIYDIHTRLLQDLCEELKEHFGVEE